jgi:hypothetical protein
MDGRLPVVIQQDQRAALPWREVGRKRNVGGWGDTQSLLEHLGKPLEGQAQSGLRWRHVQEGRGGRLSSEAKLIAASEKPTDGELTDQRVGAEARRSQRHFQDAATQCIPAEAFKFF